MLQGAGAHLGAPAPWETTPQAELSPAVAQGKHIWTTPHSPKLQGWVCPPALLFPSLCSLSSPFPLSSPVGALARGRAAAMRPVASVPAVPAPTAPSPPVSHKGSYSPYNVNEFSLKAAKLLGDKARRQGAGCFASSSRRVSHPAGPRTILPGGAPALPLSSPPLCALPSLTRGRGQGQDPVGLGSAVGITRALPDQADSEPRRNKRAEFTLLIRFHRIYPPLSVLIFACTHFPTLSELPGAQLTALTSLPLKRSWRGARGTAGLGPDSSSPTQLTRRGEQNMLFYSSQILPPNHLNPN